MSSLLVGDAFADREAEREILEIGRARHHHRVADAVIDQGDRRLLRQHVDAVECGAVAGDPPHARRLGHRRQRAGLFGLFSLVRLAHHPAKSFSRGDADLARRLAQRLIVALPFRLLVRQANLTAVTLYSGQLVAQSEYRW